MVEVSVVELGENVAAQCMRSHAASVHSTGARVSALGGDMTVAQGGTRGAFRGRRAVTERRAKSANIRQIVMPISF